MAAFIRSEFNKYKRELTVILCSTVYLIWFYILEQTVTDNYHIIHVGLDDYIPFCEYFIVPYLFWFLYVGFTMAWLYRRDRDTFFKACAFLFTGMFISLFICTFYPNGTNFRPHIDPDKNIFSAIVYVLYRADTCTNVLPSIHVYNSLGIHIAITKTKALKDRPVIRAASLIACISICLATVFLKQHSVVDGFAAMVMAYVVYDVVYVPVASADTVRKKRKLAKTANVTDIS